MTREVIAAASRMWLGNNDTRRTPFIVVWGSKDGLHPSGVRWGVCDRKSELLLFELSNDDWLRPRALGQSVGGSWVVCHRKSELLDALLPIFHARQ